MANTNQKLAFPALAALVVGSMVGAGVFSLPAAFGRATGGFGALIAWAIAGGGMLALSFVFQTLSTRRPDLDAGIYAYAKDGYGDYTGFIAALGFWAGSCVGNVSYFVLIKATLGAFFPAFGDGNTVIAILVSTALLWMFHGLILMGVKQAAGVNTVVTLAKLIPLGIFIVLAIGAFRADIFSLNFWGAVPAVNPPADLAHLNYYGQVGHHALQLPANLPVTDSLFSQVRNTMLVTVFVFIGIEGASVYSRYAKTRKDVGVATVLGFLGVLALFASLTMISYGVMPRQELAALRQPSVAGLLEFVVGRWGALFISAGLIISVLGAYLSWSLLAAEVLYSAAKSRLMPEFLASENSRRVPAGAMWMTSGLIQVLLIVTAFSEYAFTLAIELTSSLSLIPYLLVAAFGVKAARSGQGYGPGDRQGKDTAIAMVATVYSLLMLYAGGMKYLLLSSLIFAPGTVLYVLARREQGLRVFTSAEKGFTAVIVIAALAALFALGTGRIII